MSLARQFAATHVPRRIKAPVTLRAFAPRNRGLRLDLSIIWPNSIRYHIHHGYSIRARICPRVSFVRATESLHAMEEMTANGCSRDQITHRHPGSGSHHVSSGGGSVSDGHHHDL
jgi:hypothetical protein